MPRVLIVDDDKHSLEGVAEWVSAEGFEIETAETVETASALLEASDFDLALLDLQLPDGTGVEIMHKLRTMSDADVVIVTGHGSIDSAVETFRSGATDYLTKPIDLARLGKILEKIRKTSDLRDQVSRLRRELRRLGRFGSMIGSSPRMQELYDMISKVARSGATAFLTGETGVGKELAAERVHELSPRSNRQFVAVNCGAMPENLIESELFGHEKGAFTNADRRRKGVLEQADGGTLFLDEVTEMPVDLQVKLLRVLETGTFRRLGGESNVEVDVRFIAATNRDPKQAVTDGKLREDLLYRLNVLPIVVPPLRERDGDIDLLAQHFLDQRNAESNETKKLTESAREKLRAHSWPGNVRELKNVIERSFILASNKIEPVHVPLSVAVSSRSGGSELEIPVGTTLKDAERKLILATLEQTDWNRKAAADMLGISSKTLYNRLKKFEADGIVVER